MKENRKEDLKRNFHIYLRLQKLEKPHHCHEEILACQQPWNYIHRETSKRLAAFREFDFHSFQMYLL